jgi:cell wall-associated NlpC family hydrolase
MTIRFAPSVPVVAVLLAGMTTALPAQRTRFEAAYGAWFPANDSTAQVFTAGVTQPLAGFLGVGFGLVHVAHDPAAVGRTTTGGEVTVRLGGLERGFYAIAASGIGFRHGSGNPDAFWSLGAGFGVRLFSSISLGLEGLYRVEDAGVGGFWRLDASDRKGVLALARLSFRIPGTAAAGQAVSASDPPRAGGEAPPPPPAPYDAARAAGASDEAARLTASVVETALAAMGAPYNWGGTDQNGFDCSGLIQYAYGQHGVVLPRISRDQMRMGRAVDRRADALRPGDVLGFSADRSSRITHVGLHVGDGQFIHSSSTGVKLSSLGAGDPDSRWWRDRWVGVRRIVE